MGHHMHPYALQSAAFLFSLLVPSGVFVLLLGASLERRRRVKGPRLNEAALAWHLREASRLSS